jgi:hypothetical protein
MANTPPPIDTPGWWPYYFSLIDQRLSGILTSINILQKEIQTMVLDLTALTAQVAATETIEQSAVTLLTEFAAELLANANDPAAVASLATRLENSAGSLAKAIANVPVANT